jgi:predicted dehydrogenase
MINRPRRKIAFLGVDHPHGSAWRKLLDGFVEQVEISAIMAGLDGGLASLEEKYAAVPRFADIETLLSDGEFEGAIVCLSNRESPSIIRRLINSGKHVLVEKPGAGTASELSSLVAACEERAIAFQSGYMWRYDDIANRLKTMVADGQFGKLVHIDMKFVTVDVQRRDPNHYLFDAEQSKRGFFNWLACHHVDLLSFITDRELVAVTAKLGRFGETDTPLDDGGTAIFELEGNVLATFTGGYWLPRWDGVSQWSLYGSKRWVHWYPTFPDTSGRLEIHGPKPHWFAMDDTYDSPPDSTPGYGGSRGMALVDDWLDSFQTGVPCRNSPESLVKTLHWMDAVYQASDNGQRVSF